MCKGNKVILPEDHGLSVLTDQVRTVHGYLRLTGCIALCREEQMKYTCAEASKLLRKLNEELKVLRAKELKGYLFTAAVDEDIESARPVYDYGKAQEEQNKIEEEIRKVKHAINRFNIETTVPGVGMTVDEVLVYIPQLSERKRKLTEMASFLPKERVSKGYQATKIIEYTYTNYEIEKAAKDLADVTDELAKVQTALDVVNNREQMDIDI